MEFISHKAIKTLRSLWMKIYNLIKWNICPLIAGRVSISKVWSLADDNLLALHPHILMSNVSSLPHKIRCQNDFKLDLLWFNDPVYTIIALLNISYRLWWCVLLIYLGIIFCVVQYKDAFMKANPGYKWCPATNKPVKSPSHSMSTPRKKVWPLPSNPNKDASVAKKLNKTDGAPQLNFAMAGGSNFTVHIYHECTMSVHLLIYYNKYSAVQNATRPPRDLLFLQ